MFLKCLKRNARKRYCKKINKCKPCCSKHAPPCVSSVHNETNQLNNVELKYKEIKLSAELEIKAQRELETEKWDQSSQRVKQEIGIKNFSDINNPILLFIFTTWNTLISCLRFHKVKPSEDDDNIVSFILMRMISSLFLQILSLGACFTSLALLTSLIANGCIHLINCLHMKIVIQALGQFESIPVAMSSYLLWVMYGLLRSAGRELEKSKNKTYILTVFGIIMAIIVATVWPITQNVFQ